ncbi:UNVERIFIED_CONTAM: hypothetical protein FKN15_058627 [Acipenser sinensis]
MRNLFAEGLCGVPPRTGASVCGLYTLVVCSMQVVFETGHMREVYNRANSSLSSPPLPPDSIVYPLYYTLLATNGLTLALALAMLLCLYRGRCWGLILFAAWLLLYAPLSIIIMVLIEVQLKLSALSLRSLEWFGLGCRLVGDAFWLVFVVTHAIELYQRAAKAGGGARGVARGGRMLLVGPGGEEGGQEAGGEGDMPKVPPKMKFKVFDHAV